MSLRQIAARDDILYMNGGLLILTGILLPLAMLFLYAACLIEAIVPFLVVWCFSVLPIAAMQIFRPYYPYRILMDIIPGYQLTVAQRRALAFLKGREAKRLALAVAAALTLIVGLSAGLAVVLPLEEYLPKFLRRVGPPPTGVERYTDTLLVAFIASFLNLLAGCFAHAGLSCWYILRHWERIQATYPPWPITELNRHFTYGLKEPKGRPVGVKGAPLSPPEHPIPNPLTRPIRARDALAFACYLIGAPGLLVSVESGLRALFRLPELTLEAGLWSLGVPAASAGLLLLGWVLRHRR